MGLARDSLLCFFFPSFVFNRLCVTPEFMRQESVCVGNLYFVSGSIFVRLGNEQCRRTKISLSLGVPVSLWILDQG